MMEPGRHRHCDLSVGRRWKVQAILSPPTVHISAYEKLIHESFPGEQPNKKTCSLCACKREGDKDNCDTQGYGERLVKKTVSVMMKQIGLPLEQEDLSFCSFCHIQLQSLVGLKRQMDSLGERLASMIIGLHTLFSSPSPTLVESDPEFMEEVDIDTMDYGKCLSGNGNGPPGLPPFTDLIQLKNTGTNGHIESNQHMEMSSRKCEYLEKEHRLDPVHLITSKGHSTIQHPVAANPTLSKAETVRGFRAFVKHRIPRTTSNNGKRHATMKNGSVIPQNQKQAIVTPPSKPHHHPHSSIIPQKKDTKTKHQEYWPHVPDIDRIKETNPNILAKKILEVGRQIEEGVVIAETRILPPNRKTLPQSAPAKNVNNVRSTDKLIAPPRVNFYEDRMTRIITSVLNEDSSPSTNPPAVSSSSTLDHGILLSSILSSSPTVGNLNSRVRCSNSNQAPEVMTSGTRDSVEDSRSTVLVVNPNKLTRQDEGFLMPKTKTSEINGHATNGTIPLFNSPLVQQRRLIESEAGLVMEIVLESSQDGMLSTSYDNNGRTQPSVLKLVRKRISSGLDGTSSSIGPTMKLST